MKMKKATSKQTNKSYMQPLTESVSEKQPPSKGGKSEKKWSIVPLGIKSKNTFSEQSTASYMRQDGNKQSDLKETSGVKLRPENVLQETSKLNKKNVIPAEEQMSAMKDSWAACQTSFCPSPPFIEKMRSAERSAPTLDLTCSPVLSPQGSPLPASPNLLCQDTPSPILLLPKPRSTASSKGNCKPSFFYSAEKKHSTSKTQCIQSVPSLSSLGGQTFAPSPPSRPGAAEVCTVKQHLSSAPQSPLSLSTRPLLTSTLLDLDRPPVPSPAQSPFPEESINYAHHSGFSKVSSASLVSLSPSSTKSLIAMSRVKDSPTGSLTEPLKTEKRPRSDRDLQLMSGPSRKRHFSSSSDSEEDEKEGRKKSKMREQGSIRMKPRKLFKSPTRYHGQAQNWGEQQEDNKKNWPKGTVKVIRKRKSEERKYSKDKTSRDTTHVAEVSGVDELSQVMSYSHLSSSPWEAEVVDGDMDMDEDLELPESSNRHKVEVNNEESLKTLQQHISSINKQINKHRSEKQVHLQNVLLEEMHKLEQQIALLESMEKDLANYAKKQTLAFHYQEQETKRMETLKRALQSNMCPSLEYEEKIFTSQMCEIKKSLKSVQDGLLREMLEGQVQSVKRGLHALFFP
uniref:Uncharacterized protein n=1 Tax=Amphiprion ocellaris TaxID=80972 RepID=A0AAQ5XNA1_AMPOC